MPSDGMTVGDWVATDGPAPVGDTVVLASGAHYPSAIRAPLSLTVAHLFAQHGAPFLRTLNGPFALVVWDGREVMVARGGFGVVPLYWSYDAARPLAPLWVSTDVTAFPNGVHARRFPPMSFSRGVPGDAFAGPAPFREPTVRGILAEAYVFAELNAAFDDETRRWVVAEAVSEAARKRLAGHNDAVVFFLLSGGVGSAVVTISAAKDEDGTVHIASPRTCTAGAHHAHN